MKKFDISIHKKSTEIAISNDVVKNAAQMLERHGAMVYAWILAGVSILFYVIFYLFSLGYFLSFIHAH